MTELLTDQLTSCTCCPRNCRVNRIEKKVAACRVGADIQISHIGLHFGEEPPISGTKGSGTIFFAGCNLRCVFCQNYQISQQFQRPGGQILLALVVTDTTGTGHAEPHADGREALGNGNHDDLECGAPADAAVLPVVGHQALVLPWFV